MTPDDQETAKLRAAFAAAAGPAPDPESCPAPEAILAAVRDELPRGETRAIVDHTATCPSCAEDWRLAMAFEESEPAARGLEARPVPTPRFWPRLAPYAAAAAAAAAAVLLLWIKPPGIRQPSEPTRGATSETIQELIPERLPRQHCLLEWTERPSAIYDVRVYKLSGETVAIAEGLPEPRYPVPASALRDIQSGTRLEWQVMAKSPHDGRILAESEYFSFILD